ncbi:hypothetical protein KAM448_28970 [Aeromonas caviae]|nr:hypothetical protein KAM362_35490 [Aeromonas caviae]GJB25586.1 hypothetical protein KAM365_33360 [Aeromonas caviae]GJB34302.1 hypothetical protein KAM367_34040 [Aeromonas caviae]GKQ80603.1 hypothetical protein KAM448_28970 [Aeromonas caviae]
MVKAIKAALPMVKTVDAYDVTRKGTIKTPAVLLEALEMKPGRRVTGGRTPLTVEFYAHCVLSVKTDNVALEVRNFAARLMQEIDGNTWGLGEFAERPTGLSAFPGVFNPDEKGFESWVIGWEQTLHLGDVWEGVDFLPEHVFWGEYPNIGEANKDAYERLTDG